MQIDKHHSETALFMLSYWQKKNRGNGCPSRADIDPADFKEYLPNVMLIDVRHEPLDFKYRLIGTGIVDRSTRDYTGTRVMDLKHQRKPSIIWSLYERTALERKPALMMIPYLNDETRYAEIQTLPLSQDGTDINMLLGTVIFDHPQYSFDEDAFI